MNKKGSMLDYIFFIIALFGVLIMLAVILYFVGGFNTAMGHIANASTSGKQAVTSVWNPYYSAFTGNVNLIAFGIVFGMILLIFITMFLARLHPVFFVIYLIFWIISIFFAVAMSNAFQSFESGALGASLNMMPTALWIMNNLVLVIVVLGIIGGILLFIDINIGQE